MTQAKQRPDQTGNASSPLQHACSRQRSYSMVSLDDILAEADLTKGAMYFHFQSKQALAAAIVDDFTAMSQVAVAELVDFELSGLETLIDAVYLLSVQDTESEVTRAGIRLLDSLDNTPVMPTAPWQSWLDSLPSSFRKRSPRATSSTMSIPRTSRKCLWRWGWVSAESAISTNPSTTSIIFKKC